MSAIPVELQRIYDRVYLFSASIDALRSKNIDQNALENMLKRDEIQWPTSREIFNFLFAKVTGFLTNDIYVLSDKEFEEVEIAYRCYCEFIDVHNLHNGELYHILNDLNTLDRLKRKKINENEASSNLRFLKPLNGVLFKQLNV
ncbi:MAG: hypothetical protein JHC93_00520 [Parachlamydiales bacterium]|nr:hypothetical protein [Parachlamydiales bacterium]